MVNLYYRTFTIENILCYNRKTIAIYFIKFDYYRFTVDRICTPFNLPICLGLQNTPTACLQRCKSTASECRRYDTKQFDGEAPVMLRLWGIWSTPYSSLLTGPLWPGVVAPDRVLSMCQVELFDI